MGMNVWSVKSAEVCRREVNMSHAVDIEDGKQDLFQGPRGVSVSTNISSVQLKW